MNRKSFIQYDILPHLIRKNLNPSKNKVSKILKRSLLLRGLSLEDIAVLINISDKKSLDCLFKTALKIKQQIYGNRLVLFAPLYVSNYCSNNCLYCGFRRDNKDLMRKCLTPSQVKEEAKAILHQGHKRILLLMGEDPAACDLDRCLKTISAIYKVRDSKGNSIRRINLEISPMAYKELKKLKSAKIGTYTVFQETYHPETYKLMHPAGKKADYSWRLHTMDRALKSGIKDVGIGALFGLYEYRYEVLALIQHATHLEETYGTGPHTISVPRIKPAQNAPASQKVPCPVSDTDFKKIVAVLRCALPYTGIILSTRESPNMRKELLNLGVSQISAGSKTSPGGYKEEATSSHTEGQFSLEDTRSVAEMIRSVIKQGFIPSFCTACYRSGRVGKDFMDLAKPGLIKLHCLPNALITFQEFLEDYADSRTIKAGEKLIHKELKNIPSKAIRNKTLEYLKMVKKSGRDLYF